MRCLVLCVRCPCSIYSCSCISVVLCYFLVSAVGVKARLLSPHVTACSRTAFIWFLFIYVALLCAACALSFCLYGNTFPHGQEQKGMKYKIHLN